MGIKNEYTGKRPYDRAKQMGRLLATMPSRIEHTAVLSVRTDIRLLATLDQYYMRRGVFPNTKSELVRLALEHYHDLLAANGLVDKPFDDWTFSDADYQLTLKYGEMQRDGNNRARLDSLKIQEEQGIGMGNKNFQVSPEIQRAYDEAVMQGTRNVREIMKEGYSTPTQTQPQPQSASMPTQTAGDLKEFIPQESNTPDGSDSLSPENLAKLQSILVSDEGEREPQAERVAPPTLESEDT